MAESLICLGCHSLINDAPNSTGYDHDDVVYSNVVSCSGCLPKRAFGVAEGGTLVPLVRVEVHGEK